MVVLVILRVGKIQSVLCGRYSTGHSWFSRWWFQILFIFTSILGNDPILTNIFQMGWNHQLVLKRGPIPFNISRPFDTHPPANLMLFADRWSPSGHEWKARTLSFTPAGISLWIQVPPEKILYPPNCTLSAFLAHRVCSFPRWFPDFLKTNLVEMIQCDEWLKFFKWVQTPPPTLPETNSLHWRSMLGRGAHVSFRECTWYPLGMSTTDVFPCFQKIIHQLESTNVHSAPLQVGRLKH